jgi:hypothetical protein
MVLEGVAADVGGDFAAVFVEGFAATGVFETFG